MSAEFTKVVARLKRRYGDPALPPAKGPFELVLWENACYLLPDARRAQVFEGLRNRVGLTAEALWRADRDTLLELATMGGMRPETRVFRWLEIARIVRARNSMAISTASCANPTTRPSAHCASSPTSANLARRRS